MLLLQLKKKETKSSFNARPRRMDGETEIKDEDHSAKGSTRDGLKKIMPGTNKRFKTQRDQAGKPEQYEVKV
jgi:hypothetical protein